MLELTRDGQPIVLGRGTSVQLELNSPLFDEEVILGDYSFSFPVPAGPNGDVYGYPELPESASAAGALPAELRDDGFPIVTGTQRVRSASAQKYTVNLQGGLSALATALSGRTLDSFRYGGERRVQPFVLSQDEQGAVVFVPGLVALANDTVTHPERHDFVFAPVSNDGWLDPAQPVAGTFINPWAVLSVPKFGLPTGGSVAYDPRTPPPLCPFPWLRYVLSAIFTELGLRVDGTRFLPGELGQLVVGSTAVVSALATGFRLADVLPAVPVADVLRALRQDLGVAVLVSGEGVVRTAQLGAAVTGADAVDLTAQLAGPLELERAEPAGLTLTYATDAQDELTKDLVRDFGTFPVGAAVATRADLPATVPVATGLGGPLVPAEELRLVEQLQQWFRRRFQHFTPDQTAAEVTWDFYAHDYRPLPVQGGGPERAQLLATTLLVRAACAQLGTSFTGVFPAVRQQAFRPERTDTTRSTALRLWFWRGLQPSASDPAVRYPLVTPHNRDAQGLRLGQYSLRLDGQDGTYQRLLRPWLAVQLAPVAGKTSLVLTPEQLAAHDPARKVRLAGADYMVRKLSPTLPLIRPVPVELVKA